MNRLIRALTRVCREELLTEKWLLAPTLRAGNQWISSVVLQGQPAVNLRSRTLLQIARQLAGPHLLERNLRYCTDLMGTLLVETLWKDLNFPSAPYLGTVEPNESFFRNLHGTLTTLRMAGLSHEEIDPQSFEVPNKGMEIIALLKRYQEALVSLRWIDSAGVYRLALAAAAGNFPENVLILLPDDLEPTGLEKRLIRSFPRERCIELPTDPPWPAAKPAGTQARPNPGPRQPLEVEAFATVGEINEVRHVLRIGLSGQVPLDSVEILHTDRNVYIPLIYETFERLTDPVSEPSSDTDEDESERGDSIDWDLPVTFEEGIPARYSRPGRALSAVIRWVRTGYPQERLREMLQQGLLRVPSQEVPRWRLVHLLNSLPVGFGRDRYRTALDRENTRRAGNTPNREPSPSTEDPETREGESAEIEALGRFLDSLLEVCADLEGPSNPQSFLSAAARFLEKSVRSAGEKDNYALDALVRRIDEMRETLRELGSGPDVDLTEWLSSLPDTVRILGSRPQPGKIHVASIRTGGHSGRRHTFILGMSDTRFPGTGLQDPLLLDDECRRISTTLLTSTHRIERNVREFQRLLGRLRGRVTFSYPVRNLLDGRECFPSPALVRVYRAVTGDLEPGLRGFHDWVGPAVSFAPESPEECLNETEWWLHALCNPDDPVDGSEALSKRFPHLAAGRTAATLRTEDGMTAYNGILTEAAAAPEWKRQIPFSEEGPVLSASALERYGKCPLAYFFRDVLGLRPPDDLTVDRERWLSPLEKGDLLHEVFRRFLEGAALNPSSSDPPSWNYDTLQNLLEEQIQTWKDKKPVPSQHVFEKEKTALQETIRIFFEEESRHCTESRPVLLEFEFGSEKEAAHPPGSPVRIAIGDGKTIRLRGRIDRIDRIDQKRFALWDYKTGGTFAYENKEDLFDGGRILQHFLYLEAAGKLLRSRGFPEAEAVRFGYFFPDPRAAGLRLTYERDALARGRKVLRWICELIASGVFIPTDNQETCNHCDFKPVCGDTDVLTSTTKKMLKENPPEILKPLARLKGVER